MAVAEASVVGAVPAWRIERTFDWFGSPTARFGLRVTTRANGQDLDPYGKPDPEKRGMLLIDRSGTVVSASGYCRHVDGRRAWVEASDDSPVIEITFLDGRGAQRLTVNLVADEAQIGAYELTEWVIVRPGRENAWHQCLRCGAWRPVEDEHPAAFCGHCLRTLSRMSGDREHGHGPTWRQCDGCGGWYRDTQAREDLGICHRCFNNGDRPEWMPMAR